MLRNVMYIWGDMGWSPAEWFSRSPVFFLKGVIRVAYIYIYIISTGINQNPLSPNGFQLTQYFGEKSVKY